MEKEELKEQQTSKRKVNVNEDLYFESEAQARKYEIQRRVKLGFIYFFLVLVALFTLIHSIGCLLLLSKAKKN